MFACLSECVLILILDFILFLNPSWEEIIFRNEKSHTYVRTYVENSWRTIQLRVHIS